MDNKYEELEKWKELKANGAISEEEFEIEKYRILATKNIYKNEKSRIFFIISAITMSISLILGIISFIWHKSNMYIDTLISRNNLNKMISNTVDTSFIIFIITTAIMLIVGIIFKIKEKGGIKIVN